MNETEEIAYLSVVEMVRQFAAGNLSPVEVADAALARVECYDGQVNAFCFLDPVATRAAARASESRWRKGEALGRFDGVPVAVKDTFATAGWPTRKGSAAIDVAGPWQHDSPAVARLREQGAVLLGKTTTPEFAWKAVTDSALFGPTRNPWDLRLTPGGSSGGSAAAIAAGMAPVALGTDGGGSIRIPAAFCGVVGLKPTFGRVPFWPPSPFGGLAHAGPMAGCVEDITLLLDVLSVPDRRDTTSLPPPRVSFAAELQRGVKGALVAYCPGWAVDPHPEVGASVRHAVEVLEGLGAVVDEIDPPFEDPLPAFRVLWDAGAAKVVDGLARFGKAPADQGLLEAARRGRALSALDYLDALGTRDSVAQCCSELFERHNLLVTPTVPVLPFSVGRDVPDGYPSGAGWANWTPLTYPFNLTQQPALSLPCAFTRDGLPLGVQLIGWRHEDAYVLATGWALQSALGVGRRRAAISEEASYAPSAKSAPSAPSTDR